MERTLSSEIAGKIGQEITIQGWLHKKRLMGGLTFVNVAAIAGLLLGVVGRGLDSALAGVALFLGLVAAVFAWIGTAHFTPRKVTVPLPPSAVATLTETIRASGAMPR